MERYVHCRVPNIGSTLSFGDSSKRMDRPVPWEAGEEYQELELFKREK